MPDNTIDTIKTRVDAVEVIGQTVQLKRAGRTLKGLCPFHAEKSPSFVVWPEEGNWHCFGCGEGGSVFDFVMKRDHLEFGEALRQLADKAGVELPTRSPRQADLEEAQARLYAALASAAVFYHEMLKSSAGATARAYLERRELSSQTVDDYLLGYAPQGFGALQRHLASNGFSDEDQEAAGLLGKNEHGTFDYFRGRVLFPIRDGKGRVVGFGGRTLADDVQPKYLNSPQTDLFDKGSMLYGLDRARQAIRAEQRAVVVEGYMDVLAVHQHGFMNVVATLGTAITERHLDQLKRLAPEVVLALDADTAGRLATERGLEVARRMEPDSVVPEVGVMTSASGSLRPLIRYRYTHKTRLKVLVLPPGLDPDDLVRRSAQEWRHLVDGALAVVDFALSRIGERHNLSDPAGKSAAAAEALAVVRDVSDPVERAHYLQRLAHLLGVEERVLAEQVGRRDPTARRPTAIEQLPTGDALDEYTLALAAKLGRQFVLALDQALLRTPEARSLYDVVIQAGNQDDSIDLGRLQGVIEPWLLPAVTRLVQHGETWDLVPRDELERWLEVSVLRLKSRALFERHRQLQSMLSAGEDNDLGRWHAELARLTREIQPVQQALRRRERTGATA